MSDGGVKPSSSKSIADEAIEKYGTSRRTMNSSEDSVSEEKFSNIKDNVFHRIIMQSDASPEQKQKEIAQALAYDESLNKEDNQEKLIAFENFKEFLMTYRKEMSKKIIELSDTETFGELQSVFEDMNSALLNFENQINPLVEIIDAVNRLNMASDGAIFNVFKEIQDDKAEEERISKLREEQNKQIDDNQKEIKLLTNSITAMKTDKPWYLFGGLSAQAKQSIALKQQELSEIETTLANLQTEIESTVVRRETQFAEFSTEKLKLRELLDLSSEEHKGRQENLVKSALNYVNTTEQRSASVLSHMEGVKDQISNVDDLNGKLQKVFAVVNEAIKDAESDNETLTEKFKHVDTDESQIARVVREENLDLVNEHVEILTSSKLGTLETLGELSKEARDVRSMRDTNRQQIESTRKIHSSGTAGIASRLSTVLTAVNAAALNESKTTIKNTLNNMNEMTGEIAGMEAIKNATNLHIQNDELSKAIEQLNSIKEVSDKATDITRAALQDQKSLQIEIEQAAAKLAQSVKDAKSVTADVMQDSSEEFQSKRPKEESSNDKSSMSDFTI